MIRFQTYLIFVIFIHGHYFWLKFLHTIVRKSRQSDFATKQRISQRKTNFATKQCKIQQNTMNCTHNEGDFRYLHIFHLKTLEITPRVENFRNSPHLSCTEIWHFSTWQIFLHGHHPWCPWQILGMVPDTPDVNYFTNMNPPHKYVYT